MKRFTISVSFIGVLSIILSAIAADAQAITVELIPDVDIIGDQISVVQGHFLQGQTIDQTSWAMDSIFDTGASVVTLSYTDRALFDTGLFGEPVPIASYGGAVADGVNGQVIGDVSGSVSVVSRGIGEYLFDDPSSLTNLNRNITGEGTRTPAVVDNIHMFVGAESGSESLPTISGTPMLLPPTGQTAGRAAYINMGLMIDLKEMFPDIITESLLYRIPDLEYVNPTATLTAPPSESNLSDPIRIPLTMIGENNHISNPGDELTVAPNPFVSNLQLSMQSDPDGALLSAPGSNFLFDTGAMMSIISTGIAQSLGLNLDAPEYKLTVAGASGQAIDLKGYTISSIDIPCGEGASLQITNAPFFVYDVGPDIGGILGMNLFNTAEELLYNPYDSEGASLQVIFDTDARNVPDDYFDPNYFNYSTDMLLKENVDSILSLLSPDLTSLLTVDTSTMTTDELLDYYTNVLTMISSMSSVLQMYPVLKHIQSSVYVTMPTGIGVVPEPGTLTLLFIALAAWLSRRYCVGHRRR